MEPIIDESGPLERVLSNRFIDILEEKGKLKNSQLRDFNDSNDDTFPAKVVRFIVNRGYEPTLTQRDAKKIMGTNCFGVDEAISHYGVIPTRQQLAALSDLPFTERMLQEHRNTHLLVAVFSFTILEIRGKVNTSFFSTQRGESWYDKHEAFVKERRDTSWDLLCTTVLPDSVHKTWDEQQALLAPNEEIPSVRVLIYAVIGHFLATRERLFEETNVRGSDVDSSGRRVHIRVLTADDGGMGIGIFWGDGNDRSLNVGIATTLKPDAY